MNGKVLLGIFAGAALVAVLFRDKIAQGYLKLQEKFVTWAEDETEDATEPDHETFPDNVQGYKVGNDPR
jgi:hypothetical protein